MAEKDERSRQPNPEKCHSVLDGPECIEGEAGALDKKPATPKPGTPECDSVLEAPDCIEGTQPPERQRA